MRTYIYDKWLEMKALKDIDVFILIVSYCYYASKYVYDFNKIINYFLREDDSILPGNRRARYYESFKRLVSLGFFTKKDDHYIKTDKYNAGDPVYISMDDIINMSRSTSSGTFYGALRIYALILSKMDSSDVIPEKYRGKIFHYPISYLSKKAGREPRSIKEYLQIFSDNKIFYSKEVVINYKRILYISRYEEKKLCQEFIARAKKLKSGI